jgi:nucleosome binding factor SPN SPT16 subunit
MAETKQIRAVEMVRRIRDELARELADKSDAEIIAFYRKAGDAARESAKRGQPSNTRMEPTQDRS